MNGLKELKNKGALTQWGHAILVSLGKAKSMGGKKGIVLLV